MERIVLKKLLLQIKNIDLKGVFLRFCKSDNPLKYIMFPFGALLIMRFTIYGIGYIAYALDEKSKRLFAPLFWLLYYIAYWIETLFLPIYEYFNLYNPGEFCDYCIGELVFYVYPFFMFPYFILYLLWDLKRGKVNFSIKVFKTSLSLKKGKKFVVSKFIFWLFNCLKQVVTIPLKKILLIFVVPFTCALLSGNDKYMILDKPYDDPFMQLGINNGGYSMKKLIEDNLEAMYRKALNDPNYKYNILEPSNKLKEIFGDLNQYITKEEWQSFKCFLPLIAFNVNINKKRYNPELFIADNNYYRFHNDFRGVPYKKDGKLIYEKEKHMCWYNEEGIGHEERYYYFDHYDQFYFSQIEPELEVIIKKLESACRLNSRDCYYYNKRYIYAYTCPKYQNYITALQCVKDTVFAYLPKDINSYFSDTIYIGVYEEWLDKLNGKIFKILEEMLKHPCDYVIREKDRNRIFQCNILLKDRKYKYFELYVYDKNSKIIKNIKIKRED
jgi:hypothetical protein